MNHKVDWIDLPGDNYTDILGYKSTQSEELNTLVVNYNNLAKDQAELLQARITSLDAIIFHLSTWLESELTLKDKPKHLRFIQSIAEAKQNYLKCLDHIYTNQLHLPQAIDEYHSASDRLFNKRWKPIILNNSRLFSVKMREYWGDFWMESLDPCHRRLTPFLKQWEHAKKQDPTTAHFFLWLEVQHIPKYIPKVRHLTGSDLQKTQLTIKDGLIYHGLESSSEIADFSDPTERYLFVIDLDGKIYTCTESTGCSHSSFTCGRPVLGAGLLTTEKGYLKSVAFESGHYLPTVEAGYQILLLMIERGISFGDGIEVAYFFDRNKYRAQITQDDLNTFDVFSDALKTAQLRECAKR